MRTNNLAKVVSATREDYLRAIYLGGLGRGSKIGVTDLAATLKLSKSTVSERVKALVEVGLVEASPYSDIRLTTTGLDVAKKMTYKHRVLEVFLHDVLKIPKERIHQEAELLEHSCSDLVIQRLAEFLKHPTVDPHGSDIPKIENW